MSFATDIETSFVVRRPVPQTGDGGVLSVFRAFCTLKAIERERDHFARATTSKQKTCKNRHCATHNNNTEPSPISREFEKGRKVMRPLPLSMPKLPFAQCPTRGSALPRIITDGFNNKDSPKLRS